MWKNEVTMMMTVKVMMMKSDKDYDEGDDIESDEEED